MANSRRSKAMIHYLITHLTLVLFCGTLLADDSLTFSSSLHTPTKLVAIQQHSNSLSQQRESQCTVVRHEETMDSYLAISEQIDDRSITPSITHNDVAIASKHLESKPERIKTAAALAWQPPRLPQAVQVAGVVAIRHMPTKGCMALHNWVGEKLDNGKMHTAQVSGANPCRVETTSNYLLRLLQKVTGCLYRSAAFLATSKAQRSDLASRLRNPQTSAGQPLLRCDH